MHTWDLSTCTIYTNARQEVGDTLHLQCPGLQYQIVNHWLNVTLVLSLLFFHMLFLGNFMLMWKFFLLVPIKRSVKLWSCMSVISSQSQLTKIVLLKHWVNSDAYKNVSALKMIWFYSIHKFSRHICRISVFIYVTVEPKCL